MIRRPAPNPAMILLSQSGVVGAKPMIPVGYPFFFTRDGLVKKDCNVFVWAGINW